MDLERLFNRVLYFVILPFTAISFVLTPLTNDTRIFIAAEAIADNYYQLPYGWDAAYEVKPIGNRILNWVLYKIANSIVSFASNNYMEFGWIVKLSALVLMLCCVWYVSSRISFPYAFPFLFIAFACQANFGLLMSEWFAVLFSLVAVAMCFERDRNWFYVVGTVCLTIALLKSITVLMVVPVLCAAYLLGVDIDWKRFVAGYIAAGMAFLALCLTVWPYSIGDMLMSRLVAHVGMYDPGTLVQWFWFTQGRSNLPTMMAYYIPVILVGSAAAVIILSQYYVKNQKWNIATFVGMWCIPIGIVFVQSEFIIYHYIVIVFPAVVSAILLLRHNTRDRRKIICGSILFIFAGYVIINSAFGSFTTYEYTFWHQKESNADAINSVYNLTNQSTLLYLDPGDASFYFHANSSCHYITPMPVERSTNKWNISYLSQFKETYDCIRDYQGEYVVADVNGGMSTGYYGEGILIRKELMGMLERNYTVVDSRSWTVYKKKV